jgi:hypothetical protein
VGVVYGTEDGFDAFSHYQLGSGRNAPEPDPAALARADGASLIAVVWTIAANPFDPSNVDADKSFANVPDATDQCAPARPYF